MRILGRSTSFRLTLGFVAVLCVFGAALFLALYNLGKLKTSSEQTSIRRKIREDSLKIGRLAEKLYFCQDDFVRTEGVDFGKVGEFQRTYGDIEKVLNSISDYPVDTVESSYVEELNKAVKQLRNFFYDRILTAKILLDSGVGSREQMFQVHEESRQVLLKNINGVIDSLGHLFESKMDDADTQAARAWQSTINISKMTLIAALLASLLVIYYIRRSIVDPVRNLIKGTAALAKGNLNCRIKTRGASEFKELADSFNRMTEALQTNQQQLIQAEKMAGVGKLAAGVAHEINNPIAVILGYAKMMAAKMPQDTPEREGLDAIEEEARQCKKIIEDLLDLSRPMGEGDGETINPDELVTEVLNLTQMLDLSGTPRIERSVVNHPLPLTIDRLRLRQVILNIVRNALEELQEVPDARLDIEALVSVETGKHDTALPTPPEQRHLVFRFSDNGPGIAPEDRERLFEPFFTKKEKGTGLGLAITYSIVQAYRGSIRVTSSPSGGATFIVTLPLRPETPEGP